jgi:Ca2+-binding EF-hand superfamily protein
MKLTPVLAGALALTMFALPAAAQQQQSESPSAAECQELFKAADVDNNGSLSRDELASSEDLKDFYAADENVTNVPQGKFLTDCTG